MKSLADKLTVSFLICHLSNLISVPQPSGYVAQTERIEYDQMFIFMCGP